MLSGYLYMPRGKRPRRISSPKIIPARHPNHLGLVIRTRIQVDSFSGIAIKIEGVVFKTRIQESYSGIRIHDTSP